MAGSRLSDTVAEPEQPSYQSLTRIYLSAPVNRARERDREKERGRKRERVVERVVE